MNNIFKIILGIFCVASASSLSAFELPQQHEQYMIISKYQNDLYQDLIKYCNENNYPFFKIKKIDLTLPQNIKFQVTGESVSKEFDVYETDIEQGSFSLFCYKEKPQDDDAIDVQYWSDLYKQVEEMQAAQKKMQEEQATALENPPEVKEEDSSIIEISDIAVFDAFVKNVNKKVYVDLYGEYCGPCKMVAPKFKKWAEDNKDKAIFIKVDVEKSQDLIKRHSIQGVPALLAYDENGEHTDTKVGYPDFVKYIENN